MENATYVHIFPFDYIDVCIVLFTINTFTWKIDFENSIQFFGMALLNPGDTAGLNFAKKIYDFWLTSETMFEPLVFLQTHAFL